MIAYKQPVTVPEILEIRGVQSPSSIKTLLDKKLIVAKGRKETVGRPDDVRNLKRIPDAIWFEGLTELPSMEDFQDLAGGGVKAEGRQAVVQFSEFRYRREYAEAMRLPTLLPSGLTELLTSASNVLCKSDYKN